VAVTLGLGSAVANSDDTLLRIEAVSNRADLVSGGDVLLRVTLPRKQQGMLSVNGAAVPGALHALPTEMATLRSLRSTAWAQHDYLCPRGAHGASGRNYHPIAAQSFRPAPAALDVHYPEQRAGTGAGRGLQCADALCVFYKNTATPYGFVAYDPAIRRRRRRSQLPRRTRVDPFRTSCGRRPALFNRTIT